MAALYENACMDELTVLTDVADIQVPCERYHANVMSDVRKVIEEIVQASPDGILLSELPQKFEVSSERCAM